VAALLSAVFALGACPKKQPDQPATAPDQGRAAQQPQQPQAGPGLPADKDYAAGNAQAAVLELETKLDIAGFGDKAPADEAVKQAQAASTLKQAMQIADERGRMVFTNEDSYIPKGTELRYKPGAKYVLADPAKKQYWAMTGGELGNLLEGGPGMVRSDYAIAITDAKEKETIAGLETVRSDANIGFAWSVKTKTGDKSGKIKVNLAIWHSADAKLKAPWAKMMIDFLAVPFQDPAGQKIVDELKSKIKFPVKWAMEVINEGAKLEPDEKPPKLVTTALSIEVKDVPRADLAYPPTGFALATEPYTFGEGGQTATPELLGKLPAKQGAPPKEVEPPTEDKK
jgi:hypothetical protein